MSQHVTRNRGRLVTKRAYPDQASAEAKRDELHAARGSVLQAYRCPVCSAWHLGRPMRRKVFLLDEALATELGLRAYGHLKAEAISAEAQIRKRFAVIERRLAVDDVTDVAGGFLERVGSSA